MSTRRKRFATASPSTVRRLRLLGHDGTRTTTAGCDKSARPSCLNVCLVAREVERARTSYNTSYGPSSGLGLGLGHGRAAADDASTITTTTSRGGLRPGERPHAPHQQSRVRGPVGRRRRQQADRQPHGQPDRRAQGAVVQVRHGVRGQHVRSGVHVRVDAQQPVTREKTVTDKVPSLSGDADGIRDLEGSGGGGGRLESERVSSCSIFEYSKRFRFVDKNRFLGQGGGRSGTP